MHTVSARNFVLLVEMLKESVPRFQTLPAVTNVIVNCRTKMSRFYMSKQIRFVSLLDSAILARPHGSGLLAWPGAVGHNSTEHFLFNLKMSRFETYKKRTLFILFGTKDYGGFTILPHFELFKIVTKPNASAYQSTKICHFFCFRNI